MTSGIVTRRLSCLRPVLREWVNANRRLGRAWQSDKDAPWWYNERALISVFAGATWRLGGDAFEEFSEGKRGRRKRVHAGRVDLKFSINGNEFKAEAKQCWPGCATTSSPVPYISRWLEGAKRDVGRCPPGDFRRLAILFGVPYLKKDRERELPDRISWIIEQARLVEADAVAWVFPNLPVLPTMRDYIYPGIIVWVKEVKKS